VSGVRRSRCFPRRRPRQYRERWCCPESRAALLAEAVVLASCFSFVLEYEQVPPFSRSSLRASGEYPYSLRLLRSPTSSPSPPEERLDFFFFGPFFSDLLRLPSPFSGAITASLRFFNSGAFLYEGSERRKPLLVWVFFVAHFSVSTPSAE